MKKVTINDVARLANVSKGTVSAVINHRNVVKPDTRRAVLKAIKELHYRPRASARSLKHHDPGRGTIGLAICEFDNPFYMMITSGVIECGREKGYQVLVANSEGNHAREEEIMHSFTRQEIKGAIIAPVLEGTAEIDHLFRLKMINFPFVLLARVQGIQANVVSIDNEMAIRRAMRYLIANGHSRIVHFAGPAYASHTYERIQGFKHGFTETKLAFRDDMVVPAGAHIEDGYKAALTYFKNLNRNAYPTAVVCFNDLVAIGVLSALHEMGIDVPGSVSVIGNDDIPFARHSSIKLTTIRAPILELGRKAAEILIRNIEAHAPLPIESVILDAEFVVRDSTRPLRTTPGQSENNIHVMSALAPSGHE
jgi:DNA-binding LacI/PurR family transcriptional regulator